MKHKDREIMCTSQIIQLGIHSHLNILMTKISHPYMSPKPPQQMHHIKYIAAVLGKNMTYIHKKNVYKMKTGNLENKMLPLPLLQQVIHIAVPS